jgi:hypothetical protein
MKEPNKKGKIASKSVPWSKHKVPKLGWTDMALMPNGIAQ